jgi:uncharacterized membrane protein YeaQ/YmgE (transglycosylase-associated protein family)
MSFILFLIFGLVIGAIARLIVPGHEPGGWVVSMLIGVIGAYLGGFVGRAMGLYPSYQSTGGWVSSLIGAIVVAFVYHAAVTWRARAHSH